MKSRDLIRLLESRFWGNEEIVFDAGGCSGWCHAIDIAARVVVDGKEMGVLASCEPLYGKSRGDTYGDNRTHETRRRFTDFKVGDISWIEYDIPGYPDGFVYETMGEVEGDDGNG